LAVLAATTPNGTICQLTLEQTSQNAFSLQIPASTQRFAIKDLLANAERFVINSAGNVGIGTTSPNNKLEIAGTTANVGLDGTSNTYINFLKSAANIGYVGDANWTFGGSSSDFGIRATSNLVFGIGANERARIDSSGRLLVGTSSARTNFYNTTYSSQFQVEGDASATAQISLTSTFAGINGPNLIFGKHRSGSSGGNTIVQNNDQLGTLAFMGSDGSEQVAGAYIEAFVDGTPGANDMPGRLTFSTTADGASSPTERMRIASDGTVFIGVNSATGYVAYFANSGSATGLYISNTAAWQSTSDERLKTDIQDLDAVSRLMQIKPKSYLWKSQATSDEPTKRNLGFIAQEVQEVFPELVGESPDGMLSVEYTGLIAPLVNTIQFLKAEIDALKAEVTALKAQ
jgi:hypothetical protein